MSHPIDDHPPVTHISSARGWGKSKMLKRQQAAIDQHACDHEVGICWGRPLPTTQEIEHSRHANCAHALGVCVPANL